MGMGNLTVYRDCTPVVETEFSVENGRSPTEEIIEAVAVAADVDPIELPSLYDYVDPNAVDNLFCHDGAEQAEVLLTFTIEEWNVFIRSDGKICVCDGTQLIQPEPIFK